MSDYKFILPKGEVILDPDIKYTVYGETVYAVDLVNLDFNHLHWLDQKMLLKNLKMRQEISILYHPEVVKSLDDDREASPYWEKNAYDSLAIFRRQQTKTVSDNKEERRMMKPVVWDNNTSTKKRKVVAGLVAMGYDRVYAREIVKKFLEERGEKYMNLTVKQIERYVDEFARNVQAETSGSYIRNDSTKPCTIYLVRFTNKNTGETFLKPGITSRELGERFVSDKKVYDIEVLHTAEYTMSECVERERVIQQRLAKHRYDGPAHLTNNGKTETLSIDAPIDKIIGLMGTTKVK